MADDGRRSFGQEINAWVQTIGIVLAAAWGVYTFFYTQIIVPKSAPVNITVDLSLKRIGTGDPNPINRAKRLIPVEMRISAKNPSSREIYLLPSAWIAWGLKVEANGSTTPEYFQKPAPINTQTGGNYLERHASVTASDVVAFGGLLIDTMLKPNEVSSRTLIFYVPPNEYDSLDVRAFIPTVAKGGAVDLEWKLDGNTIAAVMYRLDAKGNNRGELKQDEGGGYSDSELGLQQATSMAELSLWQ
jgi:hypothetical protein